MSFIEGIGDDFLYVIGFLVFIGIVSLAWFSTHVNQLHFPPTLFIIERRTQRRNDNEEIDQTSSTPSNEQQTVSSPSGNETQTEHETDNELSEPEEFHCEQPTVTPIQEQIPCEHLSSDDKDSESIQITIKFLNETRKDIVANPNDTISKVKQLHFAEDLANNKMVRFIYQGRELQDRETLRTYNIRDQTTIHCQITARRIEPSNQQNDHRTSSHATHRNHNTFDASALIDTSPVNISSQFVLLLSLILGFIWYLRIKYRVLFSPISTVILILITLLFLIFTCGSLLTARRSTSNSRPTTITVTPVQHAHLD